MSQNFKYKSTAQKVILFVFSIFYIEGSCLAIDPPVLTCANVNLDGSITFEWEASTDPAVEGYQIFRSNDTFIIDLPGAGTNSYTYNILNSNVEQLCFYMYSYTNGGLEFSEQSEVTCTIFIDVSPSTIPAGYAQIDILGAFINWSTPPTETYSLFLSKDGGPMEEVNYISISDDVLHYEVIDCEANYEFYIELTGTNCVSNRAGALFEDINNPPEPFITSIYIDSTNLNVNIEWTMPSLSDEPSLVNLGGYIIYFCDPLTNLNVIEEIIVDPDVMEYSYETSTSSYIQYSFAVAAFDVCVNDNGDYSNLTPAYCNTPILLTSPTFNCDYIILKWLPYVGWDTGWDDAFGVGNYEIIMQEDNQPDVSLGYTDLLNFDGTHYVDTIYNLDLGTSFSFFIKAHSSSSNYTAISNIQTVNLSSLAGPERTYLGSASVISQDQIEITIKTDTTIQEHDYVIQKRQETDDVYQDLFTMANASENFLSYIDNDDIQTNKFSYEYRVVVINYCGDTISISNSARTMLVSTTTDDVSIINSISWSPYDEFDFPINNYKVFRSNNRGDLGEEIGFTPNITTSYIDYIGEPALESNGFFCYTVLASETPGNIHNYQGESFSNQICTQFDPLIYIPNAFMVGGGVNEVFKPVISLAEHTNYSMEIYSRSGNLIFSSESYDLGWDGINNGSEIPDGAYIYIIRIKDGQGKLHEKSGMVFKLSD